MDAYRIDKSSASVPESLAERIKTRIMVLIVCATLAVALAFGLSFYFALVANESAVARQIPELQAVAAKLKSLLVANTVAFVAVIITSFFVLARIVTSRIFEPLGLLHQSLTAIACGKLPRSIESSEESTFTGIEEAMQAALVAIRERERIELGKLDQLRHTIESMAGPAEVRASIEEVIASKSAFLGIDAHDVAAREKREKMMSEDPLFIKPR
jgi:hypothetical protein